MAQCPPLIRSCMHCLNLSASVAVKVSAVQNAENIARKVIKMLTTSAKKSALLKSCIKEDVSSQEAILIAFSSLR